ncbi:MAG: FlgB family protein [Pseudomonadota bacterium]
MYENLQILQRSISMAQHAGARQAITAVNMANADTPGFRAQQIAPFSESFDAASGATQRTTRMGHLTRSDVVNGMQVTTSDAEPAPNGNSVSIELEMVRAVEIQREHDRALTIYKHSLDLLRTSLGRR